MPDQISGYKATQPLAPIKGSKGNTPVADQSGSDAAPTASTAATGDQVTLTDSARSLQKIEEAIAKNPKSVADFKSGNEGAINFLKGQVMKLSKGKANPQLVGEILLRKLKGS